MIEVFTGIIVWALCGCVAVYIAGIVDRHDNDAGIHALDSAPITLLFVIGPFGLFVTIVALLIIFNPLKRIYNLGTKKSNKHVDE